MRDRAQREQRRRDARVHRSCSLYFAFYLVSLVYALTDMGERFRLQKRAQIVELQTGIVDYGATQTYKTRTSDYECSLEWRGAFDSGDSGSLSGSGPPCLHDDPNYGLSARRQERGSAGEEDQQCAHLRGRHYAGRGAGAA